MKKNPTLYTTFRLGSAIVLLASALHGCALPSPIPAERYHKAELLVERGTDLLREGRLAEANRFYELAAELAPLASAVDGLGCVALLDERYEEAEGLFREAYGMDGEYDEALLNLGLLRELQGRRTEAQGIYLNYLGKYPDSARARNDLFALEYDQGRGKMGILRELAKAQTLSDDPVVRANVAILKER